jgi:hypothetical protein
LRRRIELDYKSCLKEGCNVVLANLAPSLVFGLCSFVPILGQVALVNYLKGVKAARRDGKQIEIGELFRLDDVVDKVVVPLGVLAALLVFFVPGALIVFAPCLVADKGTSFDRALPAAFAFGLAHPRSSVVLTGLATLVVIASILCLVVPALVVVPAVHAAVFVAFEQHKSAIEVAAATAGIEL